MFRAGSLESFWDERTGRGAIQERAMLALMTEAAAARRKRGRLPEPAWWGGGGANPPGQDGWRSEDPPGDICSAAHPGTDATANAGSQIGPRVVGNQWGMYDSKHSSDTIDRTLRLMQEELIGMPLSV